MKIAVFALLVCGLYCFASVLFIYPSRKSIRMLKKAEKASKKTMSQKLYDLFINPIAKIILPFIKLDDYKKETLNRNLQKANIEAEPEMYIAQAVALLLIIAALGILLMFTGMAVIGVCVIILSVLVLFKKLKEPSEKVKEANEAILKEFPTFVSTFEHSLKGTNDVVAILDKYRKVAGKHFKYELNILVSELKLGNQEEALRNFDERIGIPEISDFVNAAIGVVRGTEQRQYLQLVIAESKTLLREQIKREIKKRPGKIKPLVIAELIGAMALVMTPIIMNLIQSFSQSNF